MQNYYGHMDLERLRTEVLVPLSLGEAVCYSPFSCKSQSYLEKIHISSPHVIIIEGTYSLFPTLSAPLRTPSMPLLPPEDARNLSQVFPGFTLQGAAEGGFESLEQEHMHSTQTHSICWGHPHTLSTWVGGGPAGCLRGCHFSPSPGSL